MNSNPFRKIYLEALKGDQHKLDVDNDKRIEAEDLAKLRAKKMKKEEAEELDELSKSTLGSYVKKASRDSTILRKIGADFERKADAARSPGMKAASTELSDKYKSKSRGRRDGLDKAVDRLTKEETEQIDELDKKTLASYAYKAAGDATDKARESERRASSAKDAEKRAKDPKLAFAKSANQALQKHDSRKSAAASKKSASRLSGVLKAASKLAYKEEVDLEEGSSKNDLPFDGPYTKTKPVKNSDGTIQSPMSRARELAKKALAAKTVKEGIYSYDVERAFPNGKASGVKIHAPVAPVPDRKYIKGTPENKALKAARKPINGMPTGKMKEEILDEVNHREFASQGKMHPDMAKHMTVGSEHDYYEHGTGDKVSGKVMHKSATEVHMKQTHDSYDPKKKGTVHKFKISSTLPEETTMEYTQEELALIEQFIEIAEKMNMTKASMGDVIKDFKKSDAPQFKGKSMEKRREMAIAAKLSNEETESVSFKSFALDEIKMSDLPSRKVSGKYGTEYYKKEKEKDEKGYDADDEDTPSSEKRGRGRPKGSSSGARQKGSTPKKKGSGVEMTGYPLHLPNSK